MALGYDGLILLDSNQYLVTNASINHVRPEIVSEGAFGAKTLNTATNKVHIYDLDDFSGGISIDCNFELIDQLFDASSGWVTNRDSFKQYLWYSNQFNDIDYGDAYWTKVSLSTSPNSFINSSIDLVMIPGLKEDSIIEKIPIPIRNLEIADNYIEQKYGFKSDGTDVLPIPDNAATPITFDAPLEKRPLAYWQSEVLFLNDSGDSILPEGVYVQNWSLEINNPIQKRTLCQAFVDDEFVDGTSKKTHPGPQLIQVGLASLSFNCTFVYTLTPENSENRKFSMPNNFWNVIIRVNNSGVTKNISLARIDNSEDGNVYFSKPIQQNSGDYNLGATQSIQEVSYSTQGYFTMPHVIT